MRNSSGDELDCIAFTCLLFDYQRANDLLEANNLLGD